MKLSRCHQTYCGDHRNMGTAHPTGPKCPHSKVTGWYIHKWPKVKTFAISSELLIGVWALKLFSKQKHMWTYREEMDSGTWPAPACKCAFEGCVSALSGFPHFSPPTDAMGTGGELRVLLRLRAEQFDLLCFLLCPSWKGKDAPTLWPDCTPLCPDSHETAWETETLSPCPLPPLERKNKQKKKQKNAQTELGLFTSPGWSQAWRGFPFSGAVWCLDFEDLYQKWEKQCYWKVGEGSSCFLNACKNGQTSTSAFSGLKGWITSLMAPVCLVLDSGHLLNLGWARGEKQTLGVSFSYWQQGRHRLQIIHAASCRIIRSGEKCSLSWRCLFPKNEGIYFFKEKGQNLRANQMKVNLSGEPGRWAV